MADVLVPWRQQNAWLCIETKKMISTSCLREDYIEGALEDLVLLERFRDKRSIVKDPIILVS